MEGSGSPKDFEIKSQKRAVDIHHWAKLSAAFVGIILFVVIGPSLIFASHMHQENG